MSDADTTAEPTVTVGEITVTKSYETDDFPVPAVAFRFRSEREDEAIVRLVDSVPDGVPPEDLGFHPDYGSDHWSVEDGDAVFERRLDSGEEYQTVYGIRTTDHDPAQFMTDPALDVRGLDDDTANEGADDATAASGRDNTQAARDVIAGEDDIAGLDGDDDSADAADISGTESAETRETGETDNTLGTTGTDASVSAGGVGAVLAAEIRNGDLSETDRDLLRKELTAGGAGDTVRLSHLQSRISDLEAYTDALEEFIDENGPARQLIEDVTDQLETIETELTNLDSRMTENETDIEALDSRTEENETDIDALDKGIADVQSEIGETQDSMEELREDVMRINNWRTRITTVLGDAPPEDMRETDGS